MLTVTETSEEDKKKSEWCCTASIGNSIGGQNGGGLHCLDCVCPAAAQHWHYHIFQQALYNVTALIYIH